MAHQTTIKAVLADDGDIRRVSVPLDYAGAITALQTAFGPAPLALSWVDDEQDTISIRTTADLEEAFASAAGAVPRITVARSGPAPVPAPPGQQLWRHDGTPAADPEPEVDAATTTEFTAPVEPEPEEEETPAQPAAAADPDSTPVVHFGVLCDRSDMNPIIGTRWHLIGRNYDLCEAEFAQLPEDAKASFEAIEHPGAEGIPYAPEAVAAQAAAAAYREPRNFIELIMPGINIDPAAVKGAFELVAEEVQKHFAAAAASGEPQTAEKAAKAAQKKGGKKHHNHGKKHHGHRRHHHHRGHCGGGGGGIWGRKPEVVPIAEDGDVPAGEVGPGQFGPGVAQLQIALVKVGVLDQRAISMKQGWFGPRTAEAIVVLQQRYQLDVDGPQGVFTTAVAEVVTKKLAGTFVEPAAPESEPEPEPTPTPAEVPAPEPVATAPAADEGHPWAEQLEQLANMGFLNREVLTPMLERHNGSVIFVVSELLGQ